MKNVNQIIWPIVVVAVVLGAGACAAKYRSPVNGQANPALAGTGGGAGYGSVDGPVAVSAAASEPVNSYQGSTGYAPARAEHSGYPSDRVQLPKRYQYVDGTNCPPMPVRPRR